MVRFFQSTAPLQLESGYLLDSFQLAYTCLGELNEAKSNIVWVFHALTANSSPVEWWPGLVGEGLLLDPARYYIICVNMPGSCYGSTGPLSTDPHTGHPYYHDFPLFTPRDMIRAYRQLQQFLGIRKIHIGIGGSMGGQQLLEWAIEDPALFEYAIPIATNARHSPWGIAFNSAQRAVIETDPGWKDRNAEAGLNGLRAARSVALLSYRHYRTYAAFQSDEAHNKLDNFKAASYQYYQGDKLAKRFNAFSYVALSKSMDAHNVGRERGSVIEALASIRARTLVVGIHSDILFPITEQQLIAKHIPGAKLELIDSLYGHDGFLLEYATLSNCIAGFLQVRGSLRLAL